jgi:hypothetical protein
MRSMRVVAVQRVKRDRDPNLLFDSSVQMRTTPWHVLRTTDNPK